MADEKEIVKLIKEVSDFKLEMTRSMGRLNTSMGSMRVEVSNLTEQLKKQNGHVTDLTKRMEEVELHPIKCILQEKFAAIVRVIDTGDHPGSNRLKKILYSVKEKQDDLLRDWGMRNSVKGTWKKRFWLPLLLAAALMAVGAAFLLIGMHIEELTKLGGG